MVGSLRSFGDLERLVGSVPSDLVASLSAVDVGKGAEALYRHQLPGLLGQLANQARICSITASSAIEGVIVDDPGRADRILAGRARSLRSRSEQELAGNRDTFDYLLTEDWRPLNAGLILHLHRLLFAHTASPGGVLKREDNLVVDRTSQGEMVVRFRPVPAAETEFALTELIDRYRIAVASGRHHAVVLIGLFVLDLLVIHPFEDGNGRVARALTNALLADAGYGVSRYVSLEQLIAESADSYYQSLLESTHNWHDERHDPWPWLRYFVETLVAAYGLFTQRAAAKQVDGTKQERVRSYVLDHAPPVFRLADVRQAVPGVSDQTIRLTLGRLRDEGVIAATGTGRSACWFRLVEFPK